jgi:hypothetical protein
MPTPERRSARPRLRELVDKRDDLAYRLAMRTALDDAEEMTR